MRNRQWVLPTVIVAIAAMGCLEKNGVPVSPCTQVNIASAIQVDNVDKVDLLFMVDNSNSMAEEQANLTREFPRIVTIMATGDFDGDGDVAGDGEPDDPDFDPVASLQIGVVTSDMGTGGFTVPTCANSQFGDDGILRTVGNLTIGGCSATYPSFLNFSPGGSTTPMQFASDVSCVATTGTGGCGFEQQLEAPLKALSPTVAQPWTAEGYTPPHFFMNSDGNADVENAGFVRENSVLAIVLVSDEEDCSARDPDLYNQSSATYTADPNIRCFIHEAQALHPISRYVDGLLQLRKTPNLLVFAPIVGIPRDLEPTGLEPVNFPPLVSDDPAVRDDRMETMVDPANPTRLQTSCNEPGTGLAYPPVRIVRVAQQLEAAGAGVTVRSICNTDLSGALNSIIDKIKSALNAACLARALNPRADGSVACDVLAVMPEGATCDPAQGQTPRMENGAAVFENGRAVCNIEQLVPTMRSPGGEPTGAGWFYDDFTDTVMMNCSRSPQRVAFTAQPMSGAVVRLECFQSVGMGGGTGGAMIGDFCDPAAGGGNCASGMTPAGALGCDPVARSCAVPCGSDADCRTAGLVGFRCDTRTLGEAAPDQFPGDGTARNYCVNPTCGT
ncbi:MAG: hypothetical protein AB7S26_23000 [Sandaracinaceae bacterium]